MDSEWVELYQPDLKFEEWYKLNCQLHDGGDLFSWDMYLGFYKCDIVNPLYSAWMVGKKSGPDVISVKQVYKGTENNNLIRSRSVNRKDVDIFELEEFRSNTVFMEITIHE